MDQKLIEFAMKQAGGEEAVKKAYYAGEMSKALKKAKTFKDLVAVAQSEEEWSDAVWALTRNELAEMLGGAPAAAKPQNGDAKQRRSRLTKEEVQVLRQRILEVLGELKEDEAMAAGEIADKIGDVDVRTVSLQIKALREAGQVDMMGDRWSACYFLAAAS